MVPRNITTQKLVCVTAPLTTSSAYHTTRQKNIGGLVGQYLHLPALPEFQRPLEHLNGIHWPLSGRRPIRDLPLDPDFATGICLVDLAAEIREPMADIESELAGYFVFRSILGELGLEPVVPALGSVLTNETVMGAKVLREPNARGKVRAFGMGLKVGKKVVGHAVIMKSGEDNNCD